jgi:MFS transporter, DHA1 family, multidrug resistance protein
MKGWNNPAQQDNYNCSTILFLTNSAVFFIGTGLLPLLPLYAARFGATPTGSGLYLAATYTAIALGTVLTGWLSDRLPLRRLSVSAGLAGLPALVLLGQAAAFWQVVVLTAVVWFCGGIGLALVSILTSLYADDGARGRSFGLMFLARPLAGVVGGVICGQVVAWQGYPFMFAVLGLVWASWPVAAMLGMEEQRPRADSPAPAAAASQSSARIGSRFYLVLLAALLSSTTVYVGRLMTSLSMQAIGLSPSVVASTAVVGGLVTLPITPLIGMLSDHVGRRRLLVISYSLAAGGLILLSMVTYLWHFWLVTALLFVATTANGSVATALATDVLPRHTLRRGMSWLNSMTWVAGIIGFAGTGYLTDTLGAAATCLIAAMLAIAAAGLLGGARARSPRLRRSTGAGSFWRPSRRREKELLPDS